MIQYEKSSEQIGILTFDHPKLPTNVINDQFLSELEGALKKAWSDSSVKGLILRSNKKDFMAGGDLEAMLKLTRLPDALAMLRKLHSAFLLLERSGRPVVATIAGSALGGGLELALACHRRVCLKNEKIQIGLPEVTLGLLPGGGGTQRLPRLIGIQPAVEMMTTGQKISPEKALKMGLVHELFDDIDAMTVAAKKWIIETSATWTKDGVKQTLGATAYGQPWYEKKFKIPGGGVQSPFAYQVFAASNAMVAEKTSNHYPAPKAILSCVYEGLQVPFESALQIEANYFSELVVHPVAKNMIRTLFFGINSANKLESRPKNVAKSPAKKVGILGAGMMGSGIAYAAAKAGIPVILKDVSNDAVEKGKSYSAKVCDKLIEKKRMSAEQKDKLLALISTSTDPKAVAGCDLVIETVIENRKIKAQVTKETESVCGADTIVASNTSTLPITGLAEASVRPENFVGLHFFSPVDKMPLVEIIVGKRTGEVAIAKALDFVQQIKKTPIVVNDGRGFYTSRVFTKYVEEGMALLKEGVSPALIENAGRMVGMPVGPLAVADEVSLDLVYHILKQTVDDVGTDGVDQNTMQVTKLFVEELKRLGRKSGGGFYEYPPNGKKFLWPKLKEFFTLSKAQPTAEAVGLRLLAVQAREAQRCLDEGILRSKVDGDIGSILGWGFPAYTGGAISYFESHLGKNS